VTEFVLHDKEYKKPASLERDWGMLKTQNWNLAKEITVRMHVGNIFRHEKRIEPGMFPR
jgi:hypothetical protein